MANASERAWQVGLWRLVALLAVLAIIGLFLHAVALCLLIATASALAYTLWRTRQLQRWLQANSRHPPVDDAGPWGSIYRSLHRRHRLDLARRRRLIGLLRAFRTAAAALPDATVVQDQNGRIGWFNAAASRLFGLNYPQDIGGHFSNLVRSPRVTSWLAAGDFGEPLNDVPAPTDDAIRLGLRVIPYAHNQRLLVARDMSKLAQLEQVRRDFVANVSHELRTPLTVVHGYLDLMEPEQMPELAPILTELRVQSRRMTQIVEDLLALSRLEAQDSLPEERVTMSAMLRTLKREAEALSQGRHRIEVVSQTDADLRGSTKELHSAFSNLVSNAVRYTPDGGNVTIAWQRRGTEAVFTVSDTGQGISPQHLPRITERFYRVSTSRSRETGGTGLGLAIVKHVLQLHQARMEIHSEVGIGSRFACVFGQERVEDRVHAGEEA